MVIPNSATKEAKDGGSGKESIVLSRIRMLDARLTNGDKASPSNAHTRKNVHPFNRANKTSSNQGNRKPQQKAVKQIESENRDTDSSNRLRQSSFRDTAIARPTPPKNNRYTPTINTDQNHLSNLRNSSPRASDGGSPLRRDDTVHTFEPSTVKPVRNVSPMIRPVVTTENTKQTKSLPLVKPVRYNPSPAPTRHINADPSPAMSDNNPRSIKRNVDESPIKPLHPFNDLQKNTKENNTQKSNDSLVITTNPVSSAEKTKQLPSRVALHFARNQSLSPKKTRTDSPVKVAPVKESPIRPLHPFNDLQKYTVENDTKKACKDSPLQLPSRVAQHFNQNQSSSPMKTRTDSPAKVAPVKEDSKTRALSPAGTRLTLQRHYWDKGNSGSMDAGTVTAESPHVLSTKKPPFVLEIGKGSHKVRQDPTPRNANKTTSKLEPEPSMRTSNQPFQTKIQREYRKIPPSPKRKVLQNESTLARNLNDASVVMHIEKVSSIGSSTSSGRSGLSQAELGGIAAKALELSMVSNHTKPRHGNTPLQQIISTKRSGAVTSQEQVPYAYSSAQRLSERLTRAERFTALKNAKHTGKANAQQIFPDNDGPSSPAPSGSYIHPVFQYPKSTIVVNTAEASDGQPLLTPEPSCVRRSKHLSKSLQDKANQFAMSSPTRRSKGMNTGFDNSSETLRGMNRPNNHCTNDHLNTSPQDQLRYDPLGIHQSVNSSQPQASISSHRDLFSYHAPADNAQQHSYGTAYKPPATLYKNPITFQPNSGPKQQLGLNRTVDQINSRTGNRNQPATFSKPLEYKPVLETLSPGQQLEILAREQRSKFQEDQAKYTNVSNKINVEYDDNSVYSEDGVSSVDGDIYYEEHAPVAMQQKPVEHHLAMYPIRINKVTNNYSNLPKHNSIHGNDYYSNDVLQSYRHESKRPEPLPMIQPPAETSCDNTFTGSLNKPYKTSPTTACDNTFTGSLNKPLKNLTPANGPQNRDLSGAVNDSSDSSAARPDAFRWLHQKYGNQAPIVPELAMRNQIKPTLAISKQPVSNQNIGNDEDDDVFFGLDEVNTDDDPELSNKEKSLELIQAPQIECDTMVFDLLLEQDKKSRLLSSKKENPNSNTKEDTNSPDFENISYLDRTRLSETYQSNSLSGGKEKKKRNHLYPVETVFEDTHVSQSDNKSPHGEDFDCDNESEQDENKPPASVLKNLGSAIVKSIQRACAIPEELPDIGACAMNTKMKCEEKISEAWVGLDEDENVTHGDASRTSKTTETGGALNENDIGVDIAENDEGSQASDLSSNLPHEHFKERRNEAQSKLLKHAETAMTFFGNNSTAVVEFDDTDKVEQKPTLSTDSSTTQGPKPLAIGLRPTMQLPKLLVTELKPTAPAVSTKISDQRELLQMFSTCLKKGGVEVLKLSRWNVWQVRHLTVSREAQQLDKDDENDASQCPKALLWLKQTGKSHQNRSLANIKVNGRGGMLFETMKQVVQIESNEYYDRNLPKRLQKQFPEFAGVLMHYMLNGNDRHVHFCFKTKQDAQSFITTMRIIKDVGKRTSEIEPTPTVSSGEITR